MANTMKVTCDKGKQKKNFLKSESERKEGKEMDFPPFQGNYCPK